MTNSSKQLSLFLLAILLAFNVLGLTSAYALNPMIHVPLSPPAGVSGAELKGIWSSGASNLYAAGTAYSANGSNMPLFYRNTGTGWTNSSPLLPAGLIGGDLTDIWGFNTGDVYAVGYGADASFTGLPLLYHNNGNGWVGSSPALPAGLIEGYLLDIWGSSPSNVYAIGKGNTASYIGKPLLYHNDGTGWTGTVLSLPDGWIGGSLSGVWGSSASDVYVVGSVRDENWMTMPVIYHNDGTGWTILVPSLLAGLDGGYLSSIWGSSASDIYAVGSANETGGPAKPLLYHKDGASWTVSSLSLPEGMTGGYLSSLWGSDASGFYAAGNVYDVDGHYTPWLHHNGGTGWTEMEVSLPAQFNDGFLYTVWGSSTSDLYIAGAGYPGVAGQPFPLLYQQGTPPSTFSDVESAYWARDYVEKLYTAGITGGCGTSPLRYCPESVVTRAQMAVFLERGIQGSSYTPPAVGAGTGFTDVPVDHWAAAWIKQFASDGITAGCGANTFCPEGAVTRAQMAVFLLKAKYGVGYTPPPVGAGTGFADVPFDYWSGAWIKQLAAEGITGGCGGGNYCPEASVTRAQMAVFLVKAFNLP
jgi:hypothetical protein